MEETVNITVDLSKITIGDLLTMDDYSRDKDSVPLRDIIELLDRMVAGGIKGMSVDAIPAVVEAVSDAMSKMASAEGN